MKDNTKKPKGDGRASLCFLVALCPAILCGALVLLRAELKNEGAILAISYICRLLTLLVGFFGLGCALRAANRAALKSAALYLLATSGAYLVTQVIAAVREVFYFTEYPDYLASVIFENVGAAIANALLFFLLHLAVLLIVYYRHFRGKAVLSGEYPLFSRRDRRAKAGALATLLLFLYQFIPQIINTVSAFVDEFGPTFTNSDLFYIVADYIFLFLSMLIGYVSLGIVQGYVEE